jgi:peptide/nickel transport system substrate-binding protein
MPMTSQDLFLRRLSSQMTRRGLLARSGAAGGFALARTLSGVAAAQDEPIRGGTLTFGHFGDVDNYDPLTQGADVYANYGRLMVFSTLTVYDVNLQLVPDLATSWELDGTTWTFALREGVVWHDGSPFTAEDVRYTVERTIDPATGSYVQPVFGPDATVNVVDPLTVEITLPEVNAAFPELLIGVSIVKDGSGDSNRNAPMGTGPFRFESWSPNESTVYVRNEQYYDPQIPFLDEVVFRPTPDPQVAITNLTAGSLDAISNQLVLPQTAETLESQEGIELVVVDPSTSLVYINIVWRDGPLADKRVRQGLAMCLDLEGIQELVYAGRGTPTNNFIPELSWAYTDIGLYPYDPEGAKALFAEAGYPDGFPLTIDTIEGYPDLLAIAPIWAEGLRQAGVTAEIQASPITSWIEMFLAGDYEVTFNFDINGPDPQRMIVIDFLTHINNDEWADEKLVQQILDGSAAATATVDQEARKAEYAKLEQLVFDNLPQIPVYRPAIIAATVERVEGFAIDGKGFYHFERTWLNDQA